MTLHIDAATFSDVPSEIVDTSVEPDRRTRKRAAKRNDLLDLALELSERVRATIQERLKANLLKRKTPFW